MGKWEKLKTLIKADLSWTVHLSGDRNYQKVQLERILEKMEYLEKEERKETISEALDIINKNHEKTLRRLAEGPKQEGFLFTGVPEFDKATWNKMLENLEGLS